jgi:hypothetical protein
MAATASPCQVWTHDVFNLISLAVMIPLILHYLYLYSWQTLVPEWGMSGEQQSEGVVDEQKLELEEKFYIFFVFFVTYLIIDTIVIYLYPFCVVSSPKSLIFHHFLLLPLCVVPFYHKRYHWHMILGLTTEINTFFIVLRRQLQLYPKSLVYQICNIMFYVTWIVLKLLLFPFLSYLFLKEYVIYSSEVANYVNLTMIAPVLMVSLTGLSYKWTYDMLSKILTNKQKVL